MTYRDTVRALASNAEELEQLYHTALRAGDADAFRQAIDDGHTSAPENLLYAAWFHRLSYAAAQAKGYVVAWGWVIPLALVNALLFWWLTDSRFMIALDTFRGTSQDFLPLIVLLAGPLSATFVLLYLTIVGRRRWLTGALSSLLPLAASAYVFLVFQQTGPVPFQEQYLTLMILHLPLLSWASVGMVLVTGHRDPANRFGFLKKSLEVVILGGLFVIAGGLFVTITIGLFEALDVDISEMMQRLLIAGGVGLIPVISTAIIYNPTVRPSEQAFNEGLSKPVALLMRVLLPLTLLVLLIYMVFIPLNFRAPFDNRDVLITYNGMLFAIVVLLVGATPVSKSDVSPRLARLLRLGIIAVAALALVVSVYALAAILYRTALDRLTPNRLAFIGWNVVNIALLILVLLFQTRIEERQRLGQLHRAYGAGTILYAAWTLTVILVTPWLFGIDQGTHEALPESVQELVYEQPDPILLKCSDSPNIYLLENGEKRWIDSIETFSDRGYVWRDVYLVPCDDLRSIPDGVPIPADAGKPPQP